MEDFEARMTDNVYGVSNRECNIASHENGAYAYKLANSAPEDLSD